VIFVAKYVSTMVFGGGILGGACKIWGNPYLNSTIVLFDTEIKFLVLIIATFVMLCNEWSMAIQRSVMATLLFSA